MKICPKPATREKYDKKRAKKQLANLPSIIR
jgi:hypothetical protein